MGAVTVFLDANILFSAALGGESFVLLWRLAELGRVDLCTSRYCLTEAVENLRRKYPDAVEGYRELIEKVREVDDGTDALEWARGLVAAKDAPVLAAAKACGAHLLLTGDVKHFGPLMESAAMVPAVRTVRRFLLEGPALFVT